MPTSTKNDPLCLPTDEEIAPWVDALERLLHEDWSERCLEAAERNRLELSVERLYKLLLPLSFYHNKPYMRELAAKLTAQEKTQQQQAPAPAPASAQTPTTT